MRRARSLLMASRSIGTPAGNPSTMAVRPGPCDSPAVKYRNGISPAVPPPLPQPLRRRQRHGARRCDLRGDEDEELLVMVAVEHPLEEPAERRDRAEPRQTRLVVLGRVAED